MKIQSKNKKIVSCQLIVPIDGLITVDANGIADVSPKCAALLVNNTNDWEYVVTSGKTAAEPAAPTTEETEKAEEPEEETEEEETDDERAAFETQVKAAKKAELEAMCTEAGYPEEEWKDLTKPLLAAYILKKYDEASESEEEEDDEEEE